MKPTIILRRLHLFKTNSTREKKKNILEPNKIWETIYDLAYLAGQDRLVETPYYGNDSRMLYDDIQLWAIEFEKKYDFDFDGSGYDYIIEIDKFYEEKKKDILSCNE